MLNQRKMPVGIESFEEIRSENFYYVDKTRMIEDLLADWGKVNLFTRPRRFGKSLNMSMLKSFFETGANIELFDGHYIAEKSELCESYMGKFPVIYVSLKGIDASSYEKARQMAVFMINEEARRLQFLMDSNRLTDVDKQCFAHLLNRNMDEPTLLNSLRDLSMLLAKHYDRKVILLIDEYDVPLAKANERGYYEQMTDLLRNLFGSALKTNEALYFAVLTGCLRVAKESIFTGMNNFNVYSITDVSFDEYFGFTDSEVRELLQVYGQEESYDAVKTWYDGYQFGNVEVYCPWDVICYCKALKKNPRLQPQNYWIHTSGNDLVKHFIERMGEEQSLTKTEIERLIDGEIVQKTVRQELTYKELYESVDNIWSILFMTGYLTQRGEPDGAVFQLAIPNREIRDIFTQQILTMFREQVAEDGKLLKAFCNALVQADAKGVEALLSSYLEKTISIRDTFVKKATKENFYHGILLGILGFKSGWTVMSNKEAGDGFGDIMIRMDDSDLGIIIEVKYAETANLEAECKKALAQIDIQRYTAAFSQEEIHTILKYGIVCRKKKCKVVVEREG